MRSRVSQNRAALQVVISMGLTRGPARAGFNLWSPERAANALTNPLGWATADDPEERLFAAEQDGFRRVYRGDDDGG